MDGSPAMPAFSIGSMTGGDIVMPGAFAQSLASARPERIRLLFQHDPKEPVGHLGEHRARTASGSGSSGRLVPGVPRADALRRLIERRAVDGLSIGFRTVQGDARGRERAPQALADRPVGNLDRDLSDDGRRAHRGRRQSHADRRRDRGGDLALRNH